MRGVGLLNSLARRFGVTKRRCFVHIGTHKTGTTSIQMACSQHSEKLSTAGYLYPKAGRPPTMHAQHNIAWEVNGDEQFSLGAGTIDHLLDEIADSTRHVIISAEDLEKALDLEGRFERLVERLQRVGLSVSVIVYFRNQVDYLPALYLEALNHGYSEPFKFFLSNCLREKSYRGRRGAIGLCYQTMVDQLERIKGLRLIARSYDRAARASLISDFFSALGVDARTLGIEIDIFWNARISAEDGFAIFCQNRLGRPLQAAERQSVKNHFEHFRDKDLRLSRCSESQIIETFAAGNAFVSRRYGLPELELRDSGDRDSDDSQAFCFETIFSAELAHQIMRSHG